LKFAVQCPYKSTKCLSVFLPLQTTITTQSLSQWSVSPTSRHHESLSHKPLTTVTALEIRCAHQIVITEIHNRIILSDTSME